MSTPVKSPVSKKPRGDGTEYLDAEEEEFFISAAGPSTTLPDSHSVQSAAPAAAATPASTPPFAPTGGSGNSDWLAQIGSLLDSKLDAKLGPVNESIQQLRSDLVSFKEVVRQELESLGTRIGKAEDASAKHDAKIAEIEQTLKALQISSRSGTGEPASGELSAMVIFNIPKASTEDQAKEWLIKLCLDKGLQVPDILYSKASNYSGVLFAKCGSPAERSTLISTVNNTASVGNTGKKTFAKVDMPFDVRSAEGAALSFKRMLTDWGFSKSCIKVDSNATHSSIKFAGKEIAKVSVKDFVLTLEWADGEWETWGDLISSSEFATVKSDAQAKLEKAKEWATSAKGKGKTKGASS